MKKQGKVVRLKWPNDIYVVLGERESDWKKVGGILVNTSFTGGKVDIVIGTPSIPSCHNVVYPKCNDQGAV